MTSANGTTKLMYGQYVITAGRVALADVECHFISAGDVREPRYLVSVDLVNPATGVTLFDVEAMAFDPNDRQGADAYLANLIAASGAAPGQPAPAAVDTGAMHGPALDLTDEIARLANGRVILNRRGEDVTDLTARIDRLIAQRAAEAHYIETSLAAIARPTTATLDRLYDAFDRLFDVIGDNAVRWAEVQRCIDGASPAAVLDAAAQVAGRELTTREACALFAEPEPAPRYWKNRRGALLTSPIERKGWEEITEEQHHAIKRGMQELAAFWANSASGKGPRADITR